MKKILFAIVALTSLLTAQAQETPQYSLLKKIDLPGDGKWDYMYADDASNKLYVSHGDRVHVIDMSSNAAVGEWKGLANVHGICLAAKQHKAYIANTGENNVVVYNTQNSEKIATIELKDAKKPDCILFDNFSQQVFVFCGKSNNAYVIDIKTDKVIATIAIEGKPEFACTNEKGLIYNNLEDKSEVVVIDAKAHTVVKHFSLAPDKAPTGITIDLKNDRLMSVCEETKNMVVLSASNGKLLAAVGIGEKVDGVVYDKSRQVVITSNGAGTATVIKQETPDTYKAIQTIQTHPGLKTIACGGAQHNFYLSGAEFQADGKTIAPGTFAVYVYSVGK